MSKLLRLLSVVSFACALVCVPARAHAAVVTLAWDPNPEADLAGYIVLFGTQPGRYDRIIEVGNTTTWSFGAALNNQTYYFVVQAVSTTGLRSDFSREVTASVIDNVVVTPGNGPTPTSATQVAVNRSSMTFGAVAGNGSRTAAQHAAVTFTNGTSTWTATTDAPWLQITGGSGAGSGSFTLSIKDDSYSPSNLTGTVTVTAPNVANSPVSFPVTLQVSGGGDNPIGVVDTPVDHATGVTGTIPVTGWAIDDVGIQEVVIYRDLVEGETTPSPTGKVFIGRAVFVEGARPDVDAAMDLPFDNQAGWGYMLLTNMLPNQGNGTYTFHVYATDVDGHTVVLGSRTITCNNSEATKPFGAIDSPEQGGTVSGLYTNHGWALTPQPNSIATDGSTILVYIDGVPVGRPSYNNARADVAALFPGYANSGGAGGSYTFDTTELANGVHTIAWVVTDSDGNAEGIGSRFFTVMNGSSSSTMTLEASTSIKEMSGQGAETIASAPAGASVGLDASSIEWIPVSTVPVYRRDGYDQNASLDLTPADESGVVHITADATGRFTLTLSAPVTDESGGYEGYIIADGKLQALPVGSFLDRRSGEFYWQPGVGFIGTYQLVFIRTENGQKVRVPVTVTIKG